MILSERIYSDVRIWRKDRPIGLGFVLDENRVMTCAHVVRDALGDPQIWDAEGNPSKAVTIDFPGLLYRGGIPVERVGYVETWRPTIEAIRQDIAILRLDQPVPSGIKPVRACHVSQPGDTYRAFGIDAQNPEGFIVQSEDVDRIAADRYIINTRGGDFRPRPGCSGGAVWNICRNGIIGMMVARKGEGSGEIIPVDRLLQVSRISPESSGDFAAAFQDASPSLAQHLMLQLETFDRQQQLADFQDALDRVWAMDRQPIVCIVACRDDDRPDVLQRRFLSEHLRIQLESMNINGQRLSAEHLRWPSRRNIHVDRELRGLKSQIKLHIPKVTAVEPEQIQSAYNLSLRPMVFYSKIEARVFNKSHEHLVGEWLRFWTQVGGGYLNKPLVIFLRLHFDDQVQKSAIRRLFEAHFNASPFPVVRALPELSAFDESEIIDWIHETLADPAQVDHRIHAQKSVREHMKGKSARLASLMAWAQALQF